ncbi:PDR/VanB family oxidoreductase [Bordetella sp. BOR01]|uniref:PDR/VanB family oxidoreductase n=1 Tax=Bordetella sp. BOR01 TaxID=2854779 RepID=UPI001C44738D|nr:PDR/VanB family oxidoreductase [Bordetella sp. BOR01]MBV7485460.1 PDR/VanB family oxidoreductase [Bordetella sp. BOR01]
MTSPLITVRLDRKVTEALDICTFELVDAHGADLPAFTAGAHIDVHVGGVVRQYSLCNPPSDRHRYRIAVLREPQSRGGSRALHDTVAEGDMLRISAPRNHFPLAPQAGHSLLLAGGIGITPLLSMMAYLAGRRDSYTLHYCTRSLARTAFRPWLQAPGQRGSVVFHCDEDPAQRLDLERILDTAPADTHLYACGPGGFMAHVLETARSRDWPIDRLHYEYFSASPAAAATSADRPFQIRIASTGAQYDVGAEESALEALVRHGVDIPMSCGQGICGTCLTGVLAGQPEHRDQCLTPDEQARNDRFTPCCSRALSPLLVLDL